MYLEFFPEAFVQLNREISHHPRLVQRIQKHHSLGVEVIFAEVCHYCSYAINAELDGEQLEALAEILITRLKGMAVQEAIKGLSDDWAGEAWKFGSSHLH
jgi:hypothetical protein